MENISKSSMSLAGPLFFVSFSFLSLFFYYFLFSFFPPRLYLTRSGDMFLLSIFCFHFARCKQFVFKSLILFLWMRKKEYLLAKGCGVEHEGVGVVMIAGAIKL